MHFKIYLAGAMSGLDFDEYYTWRKCVKQQLKQKYEGHYHSLDIINPVDFYDFDSQFDNQKEPMEYDLWQVRTSDLIIVRLDNQKSVGTSMELMLAKELNKPIIGLIDSNNSADIHPWLIECCNKLFTDISKLVQYILEYYLTV